MALVENEINLTTVPDKSSTPSHAPSILLFQTLTKLLGLTSLVLCIIVLIFGAILTPPDAIQGNLVRLLYIHPAVAWVALYLAFGMTTLCSALYLWKVTRSLFWDRLAGVSAEVGVLFLGLTLITGSIWGRPTWGVWWTWDARLTTTAMLFILYLGYLSIRKLDGSPERKAVRNAIFALIAFIDVPIVHFSVVWWNTLHQTASLLTPNLEPKIHGSMLLTLLLSFISLSLVYVWMVKTRYDVEILKEKTAAKERQLFLLERQREES